MASWLFRCLVAGLAFTCLVQSVRALDPAKSLSQYVHNQWGKDRGFTGGTIYAISQSHDGYLWIGTDRGLVRFDGDTFTLIQRPVADQGAIGPVRALAEDSEGNLWIRPQDSQMLLYRDGQFRNALTDDRIAPAIITAMSANGRGGVLFTELVGRSIRYSHGRFETIADSTAAAGTVTSMAETLDGRIWLGTRDEGLLEIKNGKPASGVTPILENEKINALAASNNGGLWIGTDQGLRFRSTRDDVNITPPGWNKDAQVFNLAQDMDGNLWAASSRGLIRVGTGGEFSLLPGSGRKTPEITAVFEDSDGNLWFGGPAGLERLKNGLFTTYGSQAGLPDSNGGALYVDPEGRTWFAPVSGGLYCLDRGNVERIRLEGLDHDVVYSISGRGNDIWIGRQHGGLTRITAARNSRLVRTYTQADGLAQNTVYTTYLDRDGTVWAGTISGGLSRFRDGVFTTYSMTSGLSSNAVNSIVEGYDGTVWIGTSAGLDAFRNGAWSHWTRANGLPSSEIRNCFEDSQHVLWLVTGSGIAYLSSGKLVVEDHLPEALRDPIFGITEDRFGFLWLSTSNNVIRVDRRRFLSDDLRGGDIRVFGDREGLTGPEGVRRDRPILTSHNGRIWVSVQEGIAFTDPAPRLSESRPISIRIESITAAGRTFQTFKSLRIPARTHAVTIQFSGTSLESPDRTWYRFLLEGAEQTWSDPVQMRQVAYNNLHAGTYRFRVLASADGILWNGPEGRVSFSIDQAIWETWWFRIVLVLLVAAVVVFVIRRRMLTLSQQLDARFQERLSERTRIAQELHDTLLQSFHGLLLRFETVDSMLPERVDEAKAMLSDALDRADDALTESREAIQNLRSLPAQNESFTQTLGSLLEQVQGEFSNQKGGMPSCSIVVEGPQRAVRDDVTVEICRIAREALRNVLQHAKASNLEVEISFRDTELRLSFRDDGTGIESSVLRDEGKSGHWGLIGMRERATRLGADLSFWSKPGVGTEIALTIPRHLAYASSDRSLFRRIHDRR